MTGYIKKGQRLILTSFSAILLLFLLTSSACPADGSLEVRGTAYEWTDVPAGATSRIYIENVALDREIEPTLKEMQENIASDISTAPLGDVKIAIELKELIEKGEEEYFWVTRSDSSGNIDDYWVVPPVRVQLLVKASKSGYMEVIGEAEHGGVSNFVIIVVLVKDNNQNIVIIPPVYLPIPPAQRGSASFHLLTPPPEKLIEVSLL
jgi:hypothetical protein